jgi:hypothetical protein
VRELRKIKWSDQIETLEGRKRNLENQILHSQIKEGNHSPHRIQKRVFSIENQQEYNRSVEVTALPPSFFIRNKD